MSRVGKRPIELPQGVEVKVDQRRVDVKGPKGELTHVIPHEIDLEREDRQLLVINRSSARRAGALHGLTRTLLFNMVKGVTEGFQKKLQINGIGYRAVMQGETLVLNLGFSHAIHYKPPEGIEVEVSGRNDIMVTGIDKQKVGQTAAEIRAFKPPEPYKGKGILYEGERVRRKAGKTGA